MLKLFLDAGVVISRYNGEYEGGTAELWAAESREQLWDLKNPKRAGNWVPDFEPKEDEYKDKPNAFEKAHRKWERRKDDLLSEYLEGKKREMESWIEVPNVKVTQEKPGLIVKQVLEFE